MHFRMLGPLEASHGDRTIALGGLKQRATLAYLLLHANEVVPTSRLLDALWPGDDPPMSAKKMLQNAVWSLRTALDASGCPVDVVSLVTQAPGYVLKVRPECVDLHEFRQQAEAGRQVLAAGEPVRAVGLFREALASWRGTALADLVENGVIWPELASVERLRLDILEDFHEAEIRCGRHLSVLTGLEILVAREPLRERACGLLMLALYRCGRHADALEVYRRLRTSLVGDLGLEPGPELQQLQASILSHDTALTPAELSGANLESGPKLLPSAADLGVTEPPTPTIPLLPVESSPRRPAPTSVLLVQVQPPLVADPDDPEVERALAAAAEVVEEAVEQFGGRLVASMGSTITVVFDGPGSNDASDVDASPDRAIRAALRLREQVERLDGEPSLDTPAGMTTELVMRAAIVTGRPVDGRVAGVEAPPVNRALVDRCHRLLVLVPEADIWLCDRTRRLTERRFVMGEANARPPAWSVEGMRRAAPLPVATDHRSQLLVLDALLERTGRQKTTHLVTLVAGASGGLAESLDEFAWLVASRPSSVNLIRARLSPFTDAGTQVQLLRSYCGIKPSDDLDWARRQLAAAVASLNCSEAEADQLVHDLLPLVEGSVRGPAPEPAWSRFLGFATDGRTVVALVEDLHAAGDDALDAIELLADSALGALLLVVTADPSLLERRPSWVGRPRSATMTMADPPPARPFISVADEKAESAVLEAVPRVGLSA